jgi:hypothetical protein
VAGRAAFVGAMSPLDVRPEGTRRIQSLGFPRARAGISAEPADQIDEVLAGSTATRFLKVARSRLEDYREAWIHVRVDSPEDQKGILDQIISLR